MSVYTGDDIAFDLYPAVDPKDGTRLRRLTSLQKGSMARREQKGTGLGAIVVPADSDDAEAIDTDLKQYVKVERKGALVTLATSSAADDTIDTATAHGLQVGDKVELVTLTGGAGLSTTPTYYVAAVPSSTSLKLATTKTNALAGTAIDFTTDVTAGTLRKLTTVAGFFLYQGQVSLLSEDNKRTLMLSGPGTLAYLARAAMAPHSYIGDDPFDDIYRLHKQGAGFGTSALGSMFARAITEATLTQADDPGDQPDSPSPNANDRLVSALPHLTLTFDGYTDSAGAAWTPWAGEFTVHVATEDLLRIALRFMELGVELLIDPDQFELSAYNPGTLGNDRTGAAWGAGVVRFQVPTDATPATGNIITTAKRMLAAVIRRSLMWAGGQDVWGVARDNAAPVPWEGGVSSEAADESALNVVADAKLQARTDAGDVPRLRVKAGDDEANGLYLPGPGGHYDVWDSTTLNSGSTRWDWDNLTVRVSACEWRYREDDNAEWDSYVEFGSTFAPLDQIANIVSPGVVGGGPTLRLCERATTGGAASCSLSEDEMTAISTPNGDFENGDLTNWGNPGFPATAGDPEGVGGSYEYHDIGIGANEIPYEGWIGAEPAVAGRTEVARIWIGGVSGGPYIRFGDIAGGDYVQQAAVPDSVNCIEWTPAADSSSVEFRHGRTGSGTLECDNLRRFTGGSGTNLLNGTDNCAARGNHSHHWIAASDPTSSDDADRGFDASDKWTNTISGKTWLCTDATAGAAVWTLMAANSATGLPFDSTGLAHTAATDVQQALEDLDAAIGSGAFVSKVGGGGETVQAHGALGASVAIDLANGNIHTGTLTADLTITSFTGFSGDGISFALFLTPDGHALTALPASVANAADIIAAFDSSAGLQILAFVSADAGATLYGFIAGGSSVAALSDLSDVTLTSPAAGDRLRYDGSAWLNDSRIWRPVLAADGTILVGSSGQAIMSEGPQ